MRTPRRNRGTAPAAVSDLAARAQLQALGFPEAVQLAAIGTPEDVQLAARRLKPADAARVWSSVMRKALAQELHRPSAVRLRQQLIAFTARVHREHKLTNPETPPAEWKAMALAWGLLYQDMKLAELAAQEDARHGQQFKGRHLEAITRVVEAYLATQPDAEAPEVLEHLRGLAKLGTHRVILAVGAVGLERAERRYTEALWKFLPRPFPARSVVWEHQRKNKPDEPSILTYLQLRDLVKRVRRRLRRAPAAR